MIGGTSFCESQGNVCVPSAPRGPPAVEGLRGGAGGEGISFKLETP